MQLNLDLTILEDGFSTAYFSGILQMILFFASLFFFYVFLVKIKVIRGDKTYIAWSIFGAILMALGMAFGGLK